MPGLGKVRCPFCGAEAVLGVDRRTRPYLTCKLCGTQVFCHTLAGFGGLLALVGAAIKVAEESSVALAKENELPGMFSHYHRGVTKKDEGFHRTDTR